MSFNEMIVSSMCLHFTFILCFLLLLAWRLRLWDIIKVITTSSSSCMKIIWWGLSFFPQTEKASFLHSSITFLGPVKEMGKEMESPGDGQSLSE